MVKLIRTKSQRKY